MTAMSDLKVGDKARIKTDRTITVTEVEWDGTIRGTEEGSGHRIVYRPKSMEGVTTVELIQPPFQAGDVIRVSGWNPATDGTRVRRADGGWYDERGQRRWSDYDYDHPYGFNVEVIIRGGKLVA